MPNGIVPNEGLARGLFRTLKNEDTDLFPWELILWVNNYVPHVGTTLADLVEPTFAGYAAKTMNNDLWTVPVVTGNEAWSTWKVEPSVFTNTTGPAETVYGYAMRDNHFGVIRHVQRFDAADVREIGPDEVVVILPKFTRTSQAA